MFEIYQPKERLTLKDSYRSKSQIASQIIREIKAMEFEIDCVLADSLYGESTSTCIRSLQGLNLQFAVAIRSNHGVRLPAEQRVRANKWRKFERFLDDGSREVRYIREIIYGKKRALRYWEITTDIEIIPENSTWYVMTQIPGVLAKEVGNLYRNRTWIEYGFRQSKSELGWADFRVTQYSQIEKWWEIFCSAYLMIGLYTRSNTAVNSPTSLPSSSSSAKNFGSTKPSM